ncbi:MAG: hypothetical protein B6I31_00960 [Desulfobacteraceae bacterium 4572_19]|nr:MAG: hypothetical protein B6I31_00960 [Desulfobacteraceae bacterium 4572_19]
MKKLVKSNGSIQYGIFKEPVDVINYLDFPLKTPMGMNIPQVLRRFMFNQFFFLGIAGPDIIAGIAVVDLKYLGNGFAYLYDRKTGKLVEETQISPPVNNVNIEPNPSVLTCFFKWGGLLIRIENNHISVKGKKISFELDLCGGGENPLRLCTRSGYRGWTYTEKTSPVQISGKATLNNSEYILNSPDNMAFLDFSCGYMKRDTFWNWASIAATLPTGQTLGLNLACGVNETGFTENAFWIDGQMVKVDTVNFVFNKDDLNQKWIVQSFDGKVDLQFSPEGSRSEKVNAVFVLSRFSQLFGTFEGTLKTDSGDVITIKDCPGWMEDHFARW